jgi:hypothetical protein
MSNNAPWTRNEVLRVHHVRAIRSTKDRLSGGCTMTAPTPSIGEWYRHTGGDSFEVVAFDEDDGTIEIQYFDGTVEEMDTEDWESQWADRALEAAEPPEDWTGSVDVEPGDDSATGSDISGDEYNLRASELDGIDLFE